MDWSGWQRNYRNGYYNRSFDSTLGNLTVKTPRDRLELFKNALFEPYARHTSTLEETIIMMYSKGITTRKITDIQLFIADGMVGLQGAIERNYPQAKFQRCWVHLERNLYGYVRKAKDLPAARQKLNDFIEHWKKRYKRVEQLAELSGLFTFYDFPEAIRSTIYTTNVIESFNKQLKRQIDKKEQFPNEDALDRFVMTQVATYNDQNVSRIRRTRTGFTSCKDTLDAMF